jgi:CRISPR-associated protein Cas1
LGNEKENAMNGRFALVVDRRGATLEAGAHNTLVVEHADGRRERVGMAALGSVVLHGDIRLSTGIIQSLAANNVALTLFPLRGRTEAVSFTAWPLRQVSLRHRQHLAYADPEIRLTLAREVVVAKCQAMATFAHMREPGADSAAFRAMHSAGTAMNLNSLMGIEGACSERHFNLLQQAYGHDGPFHFCGRNRQPPLDEPNALMSLSYTLAQSEAVRLALHCGMDVQLGFLHGLQRERQSLALDLIEPARAALDYWVYDLLMQRKLLRPEMFSGSEGDPVRLNKEGRAIFYPAWFSEGCLIAQDPMRKLIACLIRLLHRTGALDTLQEESENAYV